MPDRGVRPFSVVVTTDADDLVLRVAGELDVATVATLTQALFAVRRAGNRRVVVDLSMVTFMDCSGLTALLLARRQGTQVVVVGATGSVALVSDVTGSARLFDPGASSDTSTGLARRPSSKSRRERQPSGEVRASRSA